MEQSFAEILNDKLLSEGTPAYPEYSGIQDISCLNDLIQKNLVFQFKGKGSDKYKAKYKAKERPQPAPHPLSNEQKVAYEQINKWLEPHRNSLSAAFTLKELKVAFRQLAKIYHPDKGGSTEVFLCIHDSYKILLDFCHSIK